MSRWGSARPRRSRLATRIDISDVDGPRLSTCGGSVDHLQRLGEKRSRKLAVVGQVDPALRRTSWLHWARHSGTCAECRAPEGHLWRQSAGSQERAAARSECILRKSKPFETRSARYELQQAYSFSNLLFATYNRHRSILAPRGTGTFIFGGIFASTPPRSHPRTKHR